MRKGMKIAIGALIVMILALVLGPMLLDLKPKLKADAYICGEPPDEVTYYCTPGSGPPRTDCGAAQTGEFDIQATTGC